MLLKKLALFCVLIFFSSAAIAETDKSYVFQIPNSKSTLNNALGAIPLIGDITTSTDLDERVFVVRISNAKTTLFIDGVSISLGTPGNVYNFEYLNKDIVLDLARMTLVSTSLLDADQKPKTYELDLLFGSADYENQIAGLEGEIAEQNSVIADQKNELANAQVSINTLSIVSDRVENLESILAEREGQLEASAAAMTNMNADIAALEARLAEAQSIISTQVDQLSDAEKTSADLAATTSRLTSLEENLKLKDDQITSSKASIDSLNKVIVGLNEEIAALQVEFDQAGKMVTSQADQLATAEASIDRLSNDIALLEKQLNEANSVIATQLSDLDTAEKTIAGLKAQIDNAETENTETETPASTATDVSDTDDQQDSNAATTGANDTADDVIEKPDEDQGTAAVTEISFSQYAELKSHLTRYANFIGHLEGCTARPTFTADWQSLNKDKDKTLITADEMHRLAISAMAELNVDFDTMDKLDNVMREARNAKSRDISDKVNNASASSYYETCMTVAIMADAVRDFDGVLPTDPIARMKVFAEFSPLR